MGIKDRKPMWVGEFGVKKPKKGLAPKKPKLTPDEKEVLRYTIEQDKEFRKIIDMQ